MRKNNFFKIAAAYLHYHFKSIFMFFLFSIIFTIILVLYRLPSEAVGYAVLLCICIVIPYTAVDFVRFVKKHNSLTELSNNITFSIDGLPAPGNLLEQDYQKLITTTFKDKMQVVSNADNTRSNMIDYYTLWAHQIKTPIAAMQLLLQCEENEQSPELSMELFKIEQYVEMVLQYLRLESTSSDFVLKKYSINSIAKQAVRKYSKLFIRKKISLDFAEFDYHALTDEKWLVFVIEQILSNALKYTNKGKISIYLENQCSTTLVIEDTGIGIESEDLPRVFEKGFTGYNGRIDKKSTGIGLYLCKRILTKLSHTITIESTVGTGTKVKIGLDTLDMVVE